MEPGDITYIEQELPSDTLLTLEVENQDIPILFSQLIVDGQVLQHPAVKQHQEIPSTTLDTQLDLLVPTTLNSETSLDSSTEISHDHILSPLMVRAANAEQSIIDGPSKVVKLFQNTL